MKLLNNKMGGRHVDMKLVEVDDARFIIDLRLSEGEYLSSTSPNIENQIKWIKNYKIKEGQGKEYYFIISNKTTKKYIGLVRIYNINFTDKSFTFGSFIINKSNSPKLAALESITMIFDFAFNTLLLEKCFFDCRKGNLRANNFYIRYGAKQIDENNTDIFYYYDVNMFSKKNRTYQEIIEENKS